MPLYEYRCERCKKLTEVIQSFSEKPLRICPHCGQRALKKLMSSPAIQFKGSGWYVTDYAGRKGAEPAGEKGDAAEKSEAAEKAEKPKAEKPAKKGSKKES